MHNNNLNCLYSVLNYNITNQSIDLTIVQLVYVQLNDMLANDNKIKFTINTYKITILLLQRTLQFVVELQLKVSNARPDHQP